MHGTGTPDADASVYLPAGELVRVQGRIERWSYCPGFDRFVLLLGTSPPNDTMPPTSVWGGTIVPHFMESGGLVLRLSSKSAGRIRSRATVSILTSAVVQAAQDFVCTGQWQLTGISFIVALVLALGTHVCDAAPPDGSRVDRAARNHCTVGPPSEDLKPDGN